ncbi:ABC transporter ATP-binding protein [Breoghania sp. L-A4]|uniref:ABC transporter ATP-binding protein n=1 Tax=Breoghania sp. L-A4 TaxID=2304600 RepID=UPI000E35C44A|nr:ABC transporter ATP-binding protein [Breoghania sp. L-A4]AXS40000.1 ABC transporter ATP-binding protein [Breoghania sp. L-A4]
MDIVTLDDLTVEFDTPEGLVRAVDGVSLSIPANRTLALVGESGSGKSVISQAIMGLLPANARIASGHIHFRDTGPRCAVGTGAGVVPGAPAGMPTGMDVGREVDIAALKPDSAAMRAIRGDRIAIIFQEPMTSLSPLHTIGDQIGEAIELHRGLSRREAAEITRDMLKLVQFPHPERALDTFPFELSGGLRQRAMIAMALVCRPALLIADEPTTALDVTIQAEILKLIKDLQGELGMSVLMITHDFGVVANVADEVVVIYHGRIMESGSAEDLFNKPSHPYLKALMRAVPRFDMAPGERLVPIRPVTAKVEALHARRPANWRGEPGTPLVRLDNVSKIYQLRKSGLWGGEVRTIKAMDAVNLTIRRGECLGLVGESGSGKTTTAKAILRAIGVEGGRIDYFVNGEPKDMATLQGKDLKAFRRRVQLIFQDPFSSLNPRMTVNDILMEPLIIHGIGSSAERAQRVRDLVELVGLDPRFLRRYPHSFSGGQRQRIGIARALALEPEFVLCDEPVSALDVSVQAQILNLLKDLQKELGLTYLFVSHNLAVVDYIADRVAVMCKGRLVELGPTHEVVASPIHPYTRALLKAVPEPSLDDRLDLEGISASMISDPAQWREPYRIVGDTAPTLVEMAPGHFVCAPGLASATVDAVGREHASQRFWNENTEGVA